ncbi:Glycerol kinase [Lactococcus lactis]|nr:Glycerol kinase [Lactococcus lactis]
MLFNINTLEWDQEILDLLNIPKIMLPKAVSNSEVYGLTKTYHFLAQKYQLLAWQETNKLHYLVKWPLNLE